MRVRIALFAMFALTPMVISAQPKVDVTRPVDDIAPFIDELTFAIVRVDVDRLNFDAALDRLIEINNRSTTEEAEGALNPHFEEARRGLKQWSGDFRQAGGRSLYYVFTLSGIPVAEQCVFLVAPLEPDRDADSMGKRLTDGIFWMKDLVHERMHGAVVCGRPVTLERLRAGPTNPRPTLANAFKAADNAAVQVVVIPTADNRRVVEEMMPTLPQTLGGGPSTTLTRGVIWAAIGLEGPPDMSLRLVVQSQDGETAQALSGLIGKVHDWARAENARSGNMFKKLDQIIPALTPQVNADRLTLALGAKQVDELVFDLMAPIMIQARKDAQRAVSASNLHGLLLACHAYASDHDGRFPPNLQTLVDGKHIGPKSLLKPRRPNQPVGYVYLRPIQKRGNGRVVLMIHEAYDAWSGGISVGFTDGHVEFIVDEARFTELLNEAKEANQALPE